MAEVCMQYKMLCAIFLIIFTFIPFYSTQEIAFSTHFPPEINLQNFYYDTNDADNHIIKKRDSGTNPETAKPTSPPQNTTLPVESPKKSDAVSVSTKSEILLNKNLGENGTGIRKNITKDNKILSVTPMVNLTMATPALNISENVSVVMSNNQTIDSDDDLVYPNLFDESYNKTLAENNITKTVTDHHQFYNSTLTMDPTIGKNYLVHMNHSAVKISDLLSQSHRRAATVRLSFEFPFYGHLIRNITIATGGFLYTGEYVHSWLAATQYIAPLMANFDTSLSNDSFIKYYDNGTSFTVQWENVSLQDKPNGGNFTFQTTLFKNGDIVFVYENIPFHITNIQDDHHPVKVGLSDAYISDRTLFFVRRKTIYEYHRVTFNHGDIKNWTSIYLTALPTCLSNKDCVSCVSKPTNDFKCMWCPGTNRCSSGMDRNRQGWLSRGCERKKIQDEAMCATADTEDSGVDLANSTNDASLPHYNTVTTDQTPLDQPQQQPRITNSEKPVSMGVSSIVTILFLISIVVALGVWLMYAYRNPHSTSGQILIRYRPSQWNWKRGEARYTAATIHM